MQLEILIPIVMTIVGMTLFGLGAMQSTPEASQLELSELEKARRAYSDLWDRYLNLQFGHIPKHVVLTQKQANEFIALTKLPEFQLMTANWDDVINRAKELGEQQ